MMKQLNEEHGRETLDASEFNVVIKIQNKIHKMATQPELQLKAHN